MIFLMMSTFFHILSNKSYYFYSSFIAEIDCFMLALMMFSSIILMLIFHINQNTMKFSEKLIYFFLFTFLVVLMNLSFIADSSLMFILFFEMNVIPMFFLIIFFSGDIEAVSSSFFMLLMNLFGSLIFMFFLASIYLKNFSLSLDYMESILISTKIFSMTMYFLMNMIFFFKLPLYFFHIWLPKAHVNASGSCSILLASLMLKLGVMGLVKFSFIFFSVYKKSMILMMILLSLTFLMLCLILCNFNDLKQMMAISSIVHMSLVPVCCYSYQEECFFSLQLMCLGHTLVSSMMFLLVTVFYEQSLVRSIDFFKSLDSNFKMLMNFLLIWLFINLGVPPLFSFMTEFYVLMYFFSMSLINLVILTVSMIILMMISIMLTSLILKNSNNILLPNNLEFKFYFENLTVFYMVVILPYIL